FAPMDTLIVMTALQHPMDPSTEYAPRPVQLSWRQAGDEEAAINALLTRPENSRAITNTQLFAL
ncbi:MAG TPA: urea carboxylase, partial [Leclercia adecarboxylata]|nr:urea carboxylase [Leclercia adecarboxylata]